MDSLLGGDPEISVLAKSDTLGSDDGYREYEAGLSPLEAELRNEEQEGLVIEGPLQAGARVAVAGTAALKAAWLEGAE